MTKWYKDKKVDWKDKTCELCEFRVYEICRRLPPLHGKTPFSIVRYEQQYKDSYEDACAEYQKEGL